MQKVLLSILGNFLIETGIAQLDDIQYVDYPELRINKNESTEMPFRYVKGPNGEPIMPEVLFATYNIAYTLDANDCREWLS